MDGFTALRRMRERGDKTPIMMLTARGETRDRIEGFDSGADNYLPKPFDPDELLSRVRAMLRRSDAYRPSVLTFGDLTLDPGSGELSCGKERIQLSGREYQLMELFLRSPGMLFSAERLMGKIGAGTVGPRSTSSGSIFQISERCSSPSARTCRSMPAGDLGICWRPGNDQTPAHEIYPHRHALRRAGAAGAEPDCERGKLHFDEPGFKPDARHDL